MNTRLDQPVLNVDHSLGISISKVGIMWGSIVYLEEAKNVMNEQMLDEERRSHHCLIDRIRGVVRKYASGETGHTLCDSVLVAALQDAVIHQEILTLDG